MKRTEFMLIMIFGFLLQIAGAIMSPPGIWFYILLTFWVVVTIYFCFAKNNIYKFHGYIGATSAISILSVLCYYTDKFQTSQIILLTAICFCALFRQTKVNIYASVLLTIVEIIIYVFFKQNLYENDLMFFLSSILPGYFAQIYLIILLRIIEKRELIYQQKTQSAEELLKVVEMKKIETETANRTKTEFLANMSHEIRTPINSILGFNELILREARDDNNAQIIKYSENTLQAGKTLLSIINDILDFSKIESGKSELIPERYELCALLHETITIIKQRAVDKKLEFITDISDDIPHILYGDKNHIKQIMLNLLSNAVKYTSTGSVTLTIYSEPHKTEELADGLDTSGNENGTNNIQSDDDKTVIDLHISVKDTGIGIKMSELSKLFEEFNRLDSKRNKSIEGTGLGLVITKFWTERMGGKIDVKSKYEIGSTFSVVIPQVVLSDETIGIYKDTYIENLDNLKVYKEPFTAPNAKILVVDDNEMNLAVFVGLLKKTQIQIDTALSGKECLNLIKEKKYDIIFMDHMMPILNGIETLHKMQNSTKHLCTETPVISLTANAITGMRAYYINEGFADYISKPITPDILENMILKYLPKNLIVKTTDKGNAAESTESTESKATEKQFIKQPEIITYNDNNNSSESSDSAPDLDLDFSVLEKHGINLHNGMLYAGNDNDTYIFSLKHFTNSKEKVLSKLKSFKDEGNYSEYSIQIHALKGNLRTIGADDLSEFARKQEEYTKTHTDMKYVNETFDELIEKVQNLCSAITDFVNKNNL